MAKIFIGYSSEYVLLKALWDLSTRAGMRGDSRFASSFAEMVISDS
jgi:hypothetical protein